MECRSETLTAPACWIPRVSIFGKSIGSTGDGGVVRDFSKWKQKILLGATYKIVAPTVVSMTPRNFSTTGKSLGFQARNRAVPTLESLGTRHLRSWVVFFTTNSEFFSRTTNTTLE